MSTLKERIIYITLCLSLYLSACEHNEQPGNLNSYAPKIIKAGQPQVRKIKIPPRAIPVKNVHSKTAGKPAMVKLESNVHHAGIPKVTAATKPVICTPGNEPFKLPKVVPATGKIYLTSLPEVFDAKDPSIKDKNPLGISSFKVLQGLKTNNIFPMMQDRAGNIWISTWEAGVSRYDGRSFTHYTTRQGLSNDNVWSMLEDRRGNIWFGTISGGVNKYDGKSFTHFTTGEGMSDNDVISMMEDRQGNLWFGTENGGVNKYDGRSFIHYTTEQGLVDNFVRSIIQDINGNIWFGSNKGISKYDGKSFSNYTTDQGLNSNNIWGITEDRAGNLWISSWGHGIDKYDGRSFMHYSSAQGLSSDNVWKILQDNAGNLWISTIDKGVNKFDGQSFTYFDVEQGLSNNVIHSLLEDKSGNIWIGTDGGGMNKFDGGSFTHYHYTQGLTAGNISCTMEDKNGNIWIGTNEQGLNKYNGNSISQYSVSQGLSSNNFITIKEDTKSNIWFGTWGGGVDKYDGKSFTNYSVAQGLSSDLIYSMIEDRKGNFWFGTSVGLCKFDGESFTQFDTSQGLTHQAITSLAEDKDGNIWMGTYGGGIDKYDGKSIAAYTVNEGLSSNDVLSIYSDSIGNIWIGTYDGGVNKFDGKYFTQYTTAQGLSNNSVGSIREDREGNMWFLSRNGLCLMQKSNIENPGNAHYGNSQRPLFKNYLLSDGFLGGGSDYNTLTTARSGKIWAGAVDRLTRYNPENDIPDTIPPNIQVRSISIFNENINWLNLEGHKDTSVILGNGVKLKDFEFSALSKWYYLPENLKLAYNNNYLTFRFVGITTKRTQHIKYQFVLEGLDEHWSSLTANTEATYNVLPPGSYTFKVKAVNSEGYWSGESAYSFTILPPWWRTAWAYLLYAFGFVLIIWLFTWYRSRRLKSENMLLEEKVIRRTNELEQSVEEKYALNKKVESQQALLNERLRISRELHDDIGSTLGSISIYSEVAKTRTDKNENTNDVLSKIGNASRELIDKMSDIVWSLNPNNDSFEQLQNRMMAFAALILAPRNILYEFIAEDELKELHFRSGQAKNIFLIFKEALHNIVKYADSNNVDITLSLQNKDLTMIIQDDGKGFDVSKTASNQLPGAGEHLGGNGVKNMTARAIDIDAKICISSKINEGTRVELTVQV